MTCHRFVLPRHLAVSLMLAVLASATFPARATSLEEKVDLLSQEIEEMKKTRSAGPAHAAADRTTVGGYGELHYNSLRNDNTNAVKKELDFHRFVLFFAHRYSERVRLFSELELEHAFLKDTDTDTAAATTTKPSKGELELEQAYVEMDLWSGAQAQAGIVLMPIGIMNETHEPPTFYGVERNPVENAIVPSTWWGGGARLNAEFGAGFDASVSVTEGLVVATTGGSAFLPRGGRQKTAEARAENLAYAGRIRYKGIPGTEISGTLLIQDDLTQSQANMTPISGRLTEAHVISGFGPFSVRALYAKWLLDDGAFATGPANGPSKGRDKQKGFYVEPSMKLGQKVGVFARHARWDNNAGTGAIAHTQNRQTDIGINFWPHANVVIKADVQLQSRAANFDGVNLGVGYQF